MSNNKIEILERALEREKKARKIAEKILENKAKELYDLTGQLKETNSTLESLLAKKDLELKGVFKNISDSYCLIDMYGNVLEMNEATFGLIGCTSKDKDINLLEFVYKDDLPLVLEAFSTLKTVSEFKDLKVRIITKNQDLKYVHINASLIYNSNGKPIAVQGIARDITREYQSQNELVKSENRLKALIQNLDSGILLEDEDCNIIFTNNKFCNLFSIQDPPEKINGQHCSVQMGHAKILFEQPDGFMLRMQAIVDKKKKVLAEELKMLDGKILERDYIPIYENKVYKGHIWSYRDVTFQRNYRKNLEAEKQKYSSIIANMHMGLAETDNDGNIVMANQSFMEITGYSEKELLGINAREILPVKEDIDIVVQQYEERKNGRADSYETRIVNKQGEIRYCLVSAAPNYNTNNKIIGSIGVILDITTLKTLEKQKEKLLKQLEESNHELQEYAHIVSHDLKSPLRSISALVSWIKEDNQESLDTTSINNIALIESTLEKMELLITDILNYSSLSSDTVILHPVDLNKVVEEVQKLLIVPEHIHLNVLNKLPIIQGDTTRLQQLFQNLLSNAIRYIDKDVGHITIDVKDRKTEYQFSVSDNGIGIAKEYHEKIFEMFHSLNESKASSGIGLSIVKKIVDMYNGQIWLESTLGEGTTFYFTFKKQ